jgi:hypothetical protein
MSDIPIDQEGFGEVQLDSKTLAAIEEGFLQLETPTPLQPIELSVRHDLTSGTDFDPLPRQIGRRLVWTAIPCIAAFSIATGVLALRPIPRIPLSHWRVDRGVDLKQPDVNQARKVYIEPAPLRDVVSMEYSDITHEGTEAPPWFRKPPKHAPIASHQAVVGAGFLGLPLVKAVTPKPGAAGPGSAVMTSEVFGVPLLNSALLKQGKPESHQTAPTNGSGALSVGKVGAK